MRVLRKLVPIAVAVALFASVASAGPTMKRVRTPSQVTQGKVYDRSTLVPATERFVRLPALAVPSSRPTLPGGFIDPIKAGSPLVSSALPPWLEARAPTGGLPAARHGTAAGVTWTDPDLPGEIDALIRKLD